MAAADGPSTMALKRAENWLGSVVVPMSQLGEDAPDVELLYATQMSVIKDHTSRSYVYRTPASNAWMKVDVAALADAKEGTWFPVGAARVPWAVDVTRGGEAAAAA